MKAVVKKSPIEQQGFTLIELVVVIVILGILAATAAPKFIDLQDDAKDAANDGIAAAMESSASLVYAKAIIANKDSLSSESVSTGIGSSTTAIVYGYPAASDIVSLLDLSSSDFPSAQLTALQAVVVYRTGATAPIALNEPCTVNYVQSSVAGARPSISVTGC